MIPDLFSRLVPHPICALFPMLDDVDVLELAEDIRQHGQREPVVHLDYVLLDGRNRLRACEIAGVEPELCQWHGDVSEIPAWILSKNLHRRHLTTSQRAMIAAELATLQPGSNQHSRVGQLADPPTQPEAARLLQVGERTVRRAREVLDSGDAELVDRVRRGEVAVSAAAEQVRARSLDEDPAPVDAPETVGGGSIPPEPTESVIDEAERVVADQVAEFEARHKEPLPNDERAALDAYWTPIGTARACMRFLVDEVLPAVPLPEPTRDPHTVVEPAVGGGAWVQAIRETLPGWAVDRFDLDRDAPGLEIALARNEDAMRGIDWLDPLEDSRPRRFVWRLCVGNRPYNGPFDRWFETSLARAQIVAYLERETITGTETRLPWWRDHPPAWVAKVVPRPKWEGAGARDTADFSDSVLVVWVAGHRGPTQFAWIDARG